jgi:small conductance mechanosensitive channel
MSFREPVPFLPACGIQHIMPYFRVFKYTYRIIFKPPPNDVPGKTEYFKNVSDSGTGGQSERRKLIPVNDLSGAAWYRSLYLTPKKRIVTMEMEEMDVAILTEKAVDFAFEVGPALVLAILTLFAGLFLIRFIVRIVNRGMDKALFDASLKSFLGSLISIILKLILILIVAGMIGIETTSLIALVGAAGLAVGLALQGSLANFAGGVIILIFKPFRVNDVIEGSDHTGTVERIDILYTQIRTFDLKVVTVPNGELANSPVINYTRKDTRRVDMSVGISYDDSIGKAREALLAMLKKDERILADPAPMVVFTNFGDSSLDLSVRAWCNTPDYWPVFWDNMERIKTALDEHEITIPFPQRDVHIFKEA